MNKGLKFSEVLEYYLPIIRSVGCQTPVEDINSLEIRIGLDPEKDYVVVNGIRYTREVEFLKKEIQDLKNENEAFRKRVAFLEPLSLSKGDKQMIKAGIEDIRAGRTRTLSSEELNEWMDTGDLPEEVVKDFEAWSKDYMSSHKVHWDEENGMFIEGDGEEE